MKSIIFFITVLFISSTSSSQITSASLQASGLTCSMCNLAIKKSLEKLPFIKDIQSDVETAIYQISFKENSTIVLAEIQKAVKRAGFSVAKLSFSATFNNVEITDKHSFQLNSVAYNIINASSTMLNGLVNFQIIDKGFTDVKTFNKNKLKIIPSFINVIQL